jgi:hypothetical protein
VQRQIAAQQKILLGQILYQCQGQVSALSVRNRSSAEQAIKTIKYLNTSNAILSKLNTQLVALTRAY